MGATIYGLLNVLWWNLVGQYMYYVYVGASLTIFWIKRFLPRFDPGPPQWWLDTWHVYAWWNDNLDDRVPNVHFVSFYRRAAKDRYEDWINDAAGTVAGALVGVVSNVLGTLYHGYATFSTWINAIRGRVGTFVPWWTTTLAAGLVWLRLRLPLAIRNATSTWSDIWEGIKTVVKDWAKVRFDTARNWVANIAPWLITGYSTVRAWYDLVSTWVTNFKNNPYGTVAGFLGYAWTALEGMYWDLSIFMDTVWVPFKVTLHDFLADPLGWMYDRVEDELIRRW